MTYAQRRERRRVPAHASRPGPTRGPTIEIFIDGTRLQGLARPAEQPHIDADSDLAGLTATDLHCGLIPSTGPAGWDPARHFAGDPAMSSFGDGDTVLLGCDCGNWTCQPLTAIVDMTHATVTWHRFRVGFRGWDLTTLGPFVFHRHQYDQALTRLRDQLTHPLGS